jgi:hypothetical protein
MRWSERIAAAWMVVGLSGLTACDPGYTFTIHNPCDAPIRAVLRDSDEFGQSGTGDAVTIAPHSTNSWTEIDSDINPPFGVLLLNGPRTGERIKSGEPDVTIPDSACPR